MTPLIMPSLRSVGLAAPEEQVTMQGNDRRAPSNPGRLGLWSLTLPSWAAQTPDARTTHAHEAGPAVRHATMARAAAHGVEPPARYPRPLG